MKSFLCLAALTLMSCATSPRQPERQFDFSALETRLSAECASGQFSGIAVVHVANREVYNKMCGTANDSTKEPISRHHRFKIYSVNKLLTAIAVMRLVETGKMEIEAPICRYVADVPEAWRAVTIRQLLQHTSGLPDPTTPLWKAYASDHPSAMRLVLGDTATATLPLPGVPGAKWSYNNFGYELLADAGAKAAGKPFERVLQEQVFDRAGMKNAVVDRIAYTDGKRHSAPDPLLVRGYNGAPGNLKRAMSDSYVQLGAGAVFATIDDLLALDRAIANGRVVSRATWRMMTGSPVQTSADDTTRAWGLGMRLYNLNGVRMETHSGGNNGYVSNFVRYPDYQAVHVVMSNRGFVHPGWMADVVAEALRGSTTSR